MLENPSIKKSHGMCYSRQFRLFSVIITLLLLTTDGQELDEDCDDGRGECKFIVDCPPIARKFHLLKNIIYCNVEESWVCCPKKVPPRNVTYYGSETNVVHATECLSYQKQIFGNCPKPLILGGTKAQPMEYPHMALLGYRNSSTAQIDWLCGGTLISKNYVVSAAHCFYSSKIPNLVRLGEIDYSTTEDDVHVQNFNINKYITYPNYDENQRYNDIVLVRLDADATFDRYVAPACLPLTNGTEFTEFIAAGWGVTDNRNLAQSPHLLKVKLEAFTDEECFELNESNEDNLQDGVRNRTQICAGSHTDVRDTCYADSGGPLFVQHPDFPCMFMLVGITSFGSVCGLPGSPGVYTRVNLYTDWIQMVVWNASTQFG